MESLPAPLTCLSPGCHQSVHPLIALVIAVKRAENLVLLRFPSVPPKAECKLTFVSTGFAFRK